MNPDRASEPPEAGEPSPPRASLSRRELLRKAGWVVPAIVVLPLTPSAGHATGFSHVSPAGHDASSPASYSGSSDHNYSLSSGDQTSSGDGNGSSGDADWDDKKKTIKILGEWLKKWGWGG